jgi:hypothetical protein
MKLILIFILSLGLINWVDNSDENVLVGNWKLQETSWKGAPDSEFLDRRKKLFDFDHLSIQLDGTLNVCRDDEKKVLTGNWRIDDKSSLVLTFKILSDTIESTLENIYDFKIKKKKGVLILQKKIAPPPTSDYNFMILEAEFLKIADAEESK